MPEVSKERGISCSFKCKDSHLSPVKESIGIVSNPRLSSQSAHSSNHKGLLLGKLIMPDSFFIYGNISSKRLLDLPVTEPLANLSQQITRHVLIPLGIQACKQLQLNLDSFSMSLLICSPLIEQYVLSSTWGRVEMWIGYGIHNKEAGE